MVKIIWCLFLWTFIQRQTPKSTICHTPIFLGVNFDHINNGWLKIEIIFTAWACGTGKHSPSLFRRTFHRTHCMQKACLVLGQAAIGKFALRPKHTCCCCSWIWASLRASWSSVILVDWSWACWLATCNADGGRPSGRLLLFYWKWFWSSLLGQGGRVEKQMPWSVIQPHSLLPLGNEAALAEIDQLIRSTRLWSVPVDRAAERHSWMNEQIHGWQWPSSFFNKDDTSEDFLEIFLSVK